MSEHRVRRALTGLKERGFLLYQGRSGGWTKIAVYILVTTVRRASKFFFASLHGLYPTLVLGISPRRGSDRLGFTEALSRLRKVKRRGKQAYACCPAHEDHHPSLSIREADTPGIGFVVTCHAGCDWRDVVTAIYARHKD
jgi:hypothetical protein